MGREGVSDKMGGVTSGKVLAFGGVEVKSPIFGPAGADLKGVLENTIAVTGGDEFNAICIEEAFCWQVVGQIIDVDVKQNRVCSRALRDTTYGLSHLR